MNKRVNRLLNFIVKSLFEQKHIVLFHCASEKIMCTQDRWPIMKVVQTKEIPGRTIGCSWWRSILGEKEEWYPPMWKIRAVDPFGTAWVGLENKRGREVWLNRESERPSYMNDT